MISFSGSDFIREVYLNARPAVDLDQVTEPIDCRNYTILISVYERILRKFHVEPGTDEYGACTFVMLNNGPQLVEG